MTGTDRPLLVPSRPTTTLTQKSRFRVLTLSRNLGIVAGPRAHSGLGLF